MKSDLIDGTADVTIFYAYHSEIPDLSDIE